MLTRTRLSCSCGKMVCEAAGKPIATVVCYCDDCQRGSAQIDALPSNGADLRDDTAAQDRTTVHDRAPVLGADGGTAYVLYRKDRFACVQGREWLRDMRLAQSSPTRRVVAACCNSGMYVDFQKGHWLSVYRARFQTAAPAIQVHIQTRFKPSAERAAGDIPAYRAFAPGLIARLLWARIAMFVS